jgi:C-terminal region of Mon2 protein
VEDRGLDELVLDEAIDCQVIEQLRDEVLPYSSEVPHQFILNVVVLLNKGSIHSATTTTNSSCDAELKLREEFAKTCFETLLQFSLLDDNESKEATSIQLTNSEGGVAGQLAITALLHRFEEVLKKFNDDERQSGKCPLPRYRLSEISFVLKAVATLIISMKKAPPAKGKQFYFSHVCCYKFLISHYFSLMQSVKQHGNSSCVYIHILLTAQQPRLQKFHAHCAKLSYNTVIYCSHHQTQFL